MRRLVFVLGCVLLVGSMWAAPALAFPDVLADYPYAPAIAELSSLGIVSGYDSGNFGPNDPVTRQQFAKMIVLTLKLPVTENDICQFSDVQQGGPGVLYPDHYVAVCSAWGITRGTSAGLFSPNRAISRVEAATMVVRGIEILHPEVILTPGPLYSASWKDSDPMNRLVAAKAEFNHLLDGLPLAGLDAQAPMPRGEVAQLLHNTVSVLSDSPPPSHTLGNIPNFIQVPLCQQATSYTCGEAALQSVLAYYGRNFRQDRLVEELNPEAEGGTTPQSMAEFATARGISVNVQENLSFEALKAFLDSGTPVICAIQAWADGPVDWSTDSGDNHWVVACGYDTGAVYFMDPWTLGHYAYIPVPEFLARWHAEDNEGHYEHLCLVFDDNSSEYDPESLVRLN